MYESRNPVAGRSACGGERAGTRAASAVSAAADPDRRTRPAGRQRRCDGPALAAVVAGECEVSFQTPLAATGQIVAGRLRAVAVTSMKRLPILPEVPTVAESGLPRYEFQSWVGVLAPAATPAAVVKILNEHAVRAARAPDVAERFARDGAEVVAGTPEAFRKQITDELQLWARVIKEMGIKAD